MFAATCLSSVSAEDADRKLSLAGEWQVALDRNDVGVAEKWHAKDFDEKIQLPGTLCDAGYGDPLTLEPDIGNREVLLNLKRKFDYVGVAWYRRTVEIPENWSGKHISLELERVLWTSELWVNGEKVTRLGNDEVSDKNDSLTTPHVFDVTSYLKPGKNTFALRIDNRKKYDMSVRNMAHAYTNETQTMWNGVLGEIALSTKDELHIKQVSIFPDAAEEKIHVEVTLSHAAPMAGTIQFKVAGKNNSGFPELVSPFDKQAREMTFDYPMPEAKRWDEFSPTLYEAVATLNAENAHDRFSVTFGLRNVTNHDSRLQVNGRPLFLRGTLECCIFPLKGYPPTDKDDWLKVIDAAKEYGLNHFRFHSWCPPKAAFEAADELGFYLQVESPYWELNFGKDEPTVQFVTKECRRILREYGNHPSFCFFSIGNEINGDFKLLDKIVCELKDADNRRLYTHTSFTFQKPETGWPVPNMDYWVTQWTDKGWIRGQGVFDQYPADFTKDYEKSLEDVPVPVISHEIGQYSVYPNLREIEKYKGNLVPLNMIAIKNDLEKKGLAGRDAAYQENTGKLAVLLYKEEIERAMKTRSLSGFQLLDLRDFPGQGTALVGLLDAFWDGKGVISGEEFRQFCSPIVPLARFAKAAYRNNEMLNAKFEVANYSDHELRSDMLWALKDQSGNVIQSGKIERQNIPIGGDNPVGEISVPLDSIIKPVKLTLSLNIVAENRGNQWDIWVYPVVAEPVETNVVCTASVEEALAALQDGKKVLLNPPVDRIQGIEGKFVPVFWSPVHFPNQAGSMGISCDPNHPALAHFPTESHANWQWRDLCKRSKTLVIDGMSCEPVVEMIDNFITNRRLANIVEAKVGKGSLLFCSIDITNDLEQCPQAEWLRISLLRYMESDRFSPKSNIEPDVVRSLIVNKEEP